jgi:hypothetical protein
VTVVDIADRPKLRVKRRHHAVKEQLLDIRRLDQRSNAVKEFTALIARIETDLGGDLGAVEKELVHTFAAASITVRNISAQIALGKQVDAAALSAIGGLALKLASKLGLKKRHVEEAPPSLAEYLAARAPDVAS